MGFHVGKWVSNLPETVVVHITVTGHNLNSEMYQFLYFTEILQNVPTF
jgi:hypothetical protein